MWGLRALVRARIIQGWGLEFRASKIAFETGSFDVTFFSSVAVRAVRRIVMSSASLRDVALSKRRRHSIVSCAVGCAFGLHFWMRAS